MAAERFCERRRFGMKIDRLLGIVLLLAGRGPLSGRALAERFEVSQRTIQRDMEVLCAAGVPVVSLQGSRGGYSVPESFRMTALADASDREHVTVALRGLLSAFSSEKVERTLDKVLALPGRPGEECIFLDFSTLREQPAVHEALPLIERAIRQRVQIAFHYVDAEGGASRRVAEPVALTYRWYAWYLLAFCTAKRDYRLFKLVRMSALRVIATPFTVPHGSARTLLEEHGAREGGPAGYPVTLLCRAAVRTQAMEYLSGTVEGEMPDGDFILRMRAYPGERMWYALLLSFGEDVQVLEPTALKTQLREHAEKIAALYRE